MPSSDYLIWIDLEMTGLKPDTDVIIEMATIVTDVDLNIVAEGPVIAIHQPDASAGRAWTTGTSARTARRASSQRVRASSVHRWRAPRSARSSSSRCWSKPDASPMCGNSICQDRRFLARHMPTLEQFFHYRNLDVEHAQGTGAPLGAGHHSGLRRSRANTRRWPTSRNRSASSRTTASTCSRRNTTQL